MADLIRHWLYDGDKTTAGGTVKGSCSRMTLETFSGSILNVALEGDEIFCPACNSVGYIKHIPPFRSASIKIGDVYKRQCLDGHLCICNCSTPPVVKATNTCGYSCFQPSEIVGEALSWFVRAGHDPADIGMNHQLRFHVVSKNGESIASIPYKITLADGSEHFGVTDTRGMTEKIYTNSNNPAQMKVPYYGDGNSTTHDHSDCCSC